jgi:hypothetical protein
MEADTVKPAFSARYTVAAPKMMPKMLPNKMDLTVSSFILASGATKGRKLFCSDMIIDGFMVNILKFIKGSRQ